eukprot:1520695-Rhodomonas_salina.2
MGSTSLGPMIPVGSRYAWIWQEQSLSLYQAGSMDHTCRAMRFRVCTGRGAPRVRAGSSIRAVSTGHRIPRLERLTLAAYPTAVPDIA